LKTSGLRSCSSVGNWTCTHRNPGRSYNNLGKDEALALALDGAIIRVRKADWRCNPQKENEIKAELYKILKDKNEVERIFPIIKQQRDY